VARLAIALPLLLLAADAAVRADDITVLSAGALEPAMAAAADGFRRQTGHAVRVQFATAAEIRERAATSVPAELVAAPIASISALVDAGRVESRSVPLGRVGIGIVMRAGSTPPDISTTRALRTALLAATTVVYNRASSGQGVEALIEKLGLTDQLAARTRRFPDAESVMRHMMTADVNAIAFGAPTAISLYTGPLLRYVGPVPEELQNYTSYAIAASPAATALAKQFVDYLASGEGARLLQRAGVQSSSGREAR
jgi:molybdate transport system substrate-binding protein